MTERDALEAGFSEALERSVADLQLRISTVHERVPCPKCGAPAGKRCRPMPRGYRPLDLPGNFRVCKSPHKWRLTRDGIHLR